MYGYRNNVDERTRLALELSAIAWHDKTLPIALLSSAIGSDANRLLTVYTALVVRNGSPAGCSFMDAIRYERGM